MKRKAATKIYEAIKDHPKNELSEINLLANDYITEGLLYKVRGEMLNLGLIGYNENHKLTFSYDFLNNIAGIGKAIESYMKPEPETQKRKAMKLRHIMSKKALDGKPNT